MPNSNIRYWGWGNLDHSYDKDTVQLFLNALSKELEIEKLPIKKAPPSVESFSIPESKLPADFIRKWASRGLSLQSLDRIIHAAGKSYRDLIRIRNRNLEKFPDGVLFLQEASQLDDLFRDASSFGITLVPFGGGTNVVGATECVTSQGRPVLIVALQGLNRLLTLDENSLTATFQAGIMGPQLEIILNQKGYTLGHFPQSFEFSTLGGWVVTRSAGQNSTRYGKIEKLVTALTLATPKGPITIKPHPASAAGPSLRDLIVGSEGLYGIVTDATIRISRLPDAEVFVAAFFESFEEGTQAVRKIMQSGLKPSVVRLSDSKETELFRQMRKTTPTMKAVTALWQKWKKIGSTPCFLLMSTEGSQPETHYQEKRFREIIGQQEGVALSHKRSQHLGQHWKKNRFQLPYLRDNMMDYSLFIDTLETATTWSNLETLASAIELAVLDQQNRKGEKLAVGYHLSHAYPDGASLYFTILGKQRIGDELNQWAEIKKAATDAIMQNGGTLTHHHAVGTDHRPWMKDEYPELGLESLRAVKKTVDPEGLLNPGKLL